MVCPAIASRWWQAGGKGTGEGRLTAREQTGAAGKRTTVDCAGRAGVTHEEAVTREEGDIGDEGKCKRRRRRKCKNCEVLLCSPGCGCYRDILIIISSL